MNIGSKKNKKYRKIFKKFNSLIDFYKELLLINYIFFLQIMPLVLGDVDIVSYMKKVAVCKQGYLHSNYFTRFENLLQFYYLKLAVLWVSMIFFKFLLCPRQIIRNKKKHRNVDIH